MAAAEILGCLTATTLIKPEVFYFSTSIAAEMDMRTTQVCFATPAAILMDVALHQLFRDKYGLVHNVEPAYVEAKVPGIQAAMLKVYRQMALGSTVSLPLAIGALDSAAAFSPTQAMIDLEMNEVLYNFYAGMEVNEETMCLDLISEMEFAQRTYLETEHTARHFRREGWLPKLLDRRYCDHESPAVVSDQTLLERADQAVCKLVAEQQPPDIDAGFARELDRISPPPEAANAGLRAQTYRIQNWRSYLVAITHPSAPPILNSVRLSPACGLFSPWRRCARIQLKFGLVVGFGGDPCGTKWNRNSLWMTWRRSRRDSWRWGLAWSRPSNSWIAYFAHPGRDFARTDEALRIRQVGPQCYVTYKGPKVDPTTKTRREIELPLSGTAEAAAQWTALLEALGFKPVREVRKQRLPAHLAWQGADVEIALDDVEGVGTFVEFELTASEEEIEQAKTRILSLAAALDLSRVERRSYLELLLESVKDRKQLGPSNEAGLLSES